MTNSFELSYKKIIKVINGAKRQAIKDSSAYVSVDYILERLLTEKSVINLISKINNDLKDASKFNLLKDDIRRIILGSIHTKIKNKKHIKPEEDIEGILYQTRLQSLLFGRKIVECMDLFVCLLFEDTKCVTYLNDVWDINYQFVMNYITEKHTSIIDNGITKTLNELKTKRKKTYKSDETTKTLKAAFSEWSNNERSAKNNRIPDDIMNNIKDSIMKIAEQDKDKGIKSISNFCKNMNELIKTTKTLPIIGREKEIETIQHTISRMLKPNLILVGQAGVGKTAIVEGLVQKIVNNELPSLSGYTVYTVDLGAMVAGTKYRGDFEERMKNLIDFAKKQEKALFFIDEIHLIIGAGSASESTMDAANILKPALSRGEICIIGATTDREYRAKLEKDKALMRRFFKLNIIAPSIDDTIKILMGVKYKFEEYFNIQFSKDAIRFMCNVADKFIHDSSFPDKAIDIIDSVGARFGKQDKKIKITSEMITQQVSVLTKIPESLITVSDEFNYDKLKDRLETNIIGQHTAINLILDLMCLSYAGLRERNKTILSLLMRGPTGVGKTELSKTLAEYLNLPLYRFDMSEYSESHTVSKLIGSPSGYVGYNDGDAGSGLLLNKVETTPHCIVLLDEIEKAHPHVINILLQVMDNGFLMGGSGKIVSFENVCVLMTSNIGALQEQKNSIGFLTSYNECNTDKGVEDMKSFFPPEFLNRLDGVVRFNNLQYNELKNITKLNIDKLSKVLKDKNIECIIDDSVINQITILAEKEKNMGARPINRLINTYIKIPLSKKILCDKNSKFSIKYDNDFIIDNIKDM